MKLGEVRRQLESLRASSENEGRLQKDAQLPLERLKNAYEAMSIHDRTNADAVIVEWLAAGDENLRFDAIALVDEFRITAAAQALRELRGRLASSESPGAPFEAEKIDRVLRTLPASPR